MNKAQLSVYNAVVWGKCMWHGGECVTHTGRQVKASLSSPVLSKCMPPEGTMQAGSNKMNGATGK